MEKKYLDSVKELSEEARIANKVETRLYAEYEVKRGLRDLDGKGVLAGLTRIGEIHAYDIQDGVPKPTQGKLIYRGIDIDDLVNGFLSEDRFGYEETCFLLLVGHLPSNTELSDFRELISSHYDLPEGFVRDVIMQAPSKDLMNIIARSVLSLYCFDDNAEDLSEENVFRQSIQLIANFPLLAIYGYQVYEHFYNKQSFVIHQPQPELSIAENILYMLRHDNKHTDLEAKLLDLALVLHAEHGGGNNSTFTAHVVASAYTDTYSVIAAAMGSLKGLRHGGANIKVVQMFDDIKANVKDWKDKDEVYTYVEKILNKEAFDKTGLIYGIGHAVYSLSDPRAVIFKGYVEQLAREKGLEDEFMLYSLVEDIAPEVVAEHRKIYKGISANVDFYSGFVYRMLDIPPQLFTPLFAISRISGWCAHILEELANDGKIIRPAYKSVEPRKDYVPIKERQ